MFRSACVALFTVCLAALCLAAPLAAQTPEARKDASHSVLQAEGVPILLSLPLIADETSSPRRRDEEVIQRLIALAIVAVKGETNDHGMALGLVQQFNATGYFTPQEQAFMDNTRPVEQDLINMSWRYEGVHVLLWALGIYPDIGRPDAITDVPLLAATLRDLGPDGLRARAKLRPQSQLLDATDLMYRYHWATVQAGLDNQPMPSGLDNGVVYERHYALNWLIGYMGQAWDDISTDT